jgi:hypothetical protein
MEGGPEPEPELEQPAAEVAPEPEIEPAAPSVGERWDVLVGRLMGEYEASSEHAGGAAIPMSTIRSISTALGWNASCFSGQMLQRSEWIKKFTHGRFRSGGVPTKEMVSQVSAEMLFERHIRS